ncbi:MAG: sulfotransferase domain-containing protein [Planctomycetota bacterium]
MRVDVNITGHRSHTPVPSVRSRNPVTEQRIVMANPLHSTLQPPTMIGPTLVDGAIRRAFRAPAAHIVSFPRAGQLWLRVMLALTIERTTQTTSANPFDLDARTRTDGSLPRLMLSHGKQDPRLWTPAQASAMPTWQQDRRCILLTRDPRDILVSLHAERTMRSRIDPRIPHFDGDVGALLRSERGGLRTILQWQRTWLAALAQCEASLHVQYEHLHQDPALELGRICQFIGLAATPAIIDEVVQASSFAAARVLEDGGRFGQFGSSLPRDARLLRRGVVGGWRDHFSRDDAMWADGVIDV